LHAVNVDLSPEQPPEIERAVAEILDQGASPEPDPWWEAGIEDSLST
jgi:hypothetical protein